ncbi:MAG TPA: folylpolyglutamate synthase/dihydrofolate synthase family protein [Flavobacteriaceae bacterium]|nr:folylpolyglutamate synthase/dihydrofolate synthase family protein [Flavobacteriaceae bacterium]
MNYQKTLDWMFAQLPMFQRQGNPALKKDLTNIRLFSDFLGNPHTKFKSIHVAGTNGKGSVSHMLASTFQEAGYKTGLYTSPHLKDFRERIKINGKEVSKQFVVDFIQENKAFLEKQNPSFFEMTTAMAFDYFARKKLDIAIIETGLGGRLDSTNIISPELSVITNIGMDHTQFLGNSPAEIAVEKAGIIKLNTPVVIGESQPETAKVFKEYGKQKNAPIFFADQISSQPLLSGLKGEYQSKNIKSVMQSIEVLRQLGWKITSENLSQGLRKVVQNTKIRGRWEILQEHPKVICDVAHNKEGLEYVLSQLTKEKYRKLHLVLGMVKDKDLTNILPLFPKKATYYFCRPDIPRGLDAHLLKERASQFELKGNIYPSVSKAFEAAINNAIEEDVIFVGGSTFVVAEVI